MNARRASSGAVEVSITHAEAVALHEALAYGEWSGEFEQMSFRDPLFVTVLGQLQQALAQVIPELGTDGYGAAVHRALDELRTEP
jgi:hypothetical protein